MGRRARVSRTKATTSGGKKTARQRAGRTEAYFALAWAEILEQLRRRLLEAFSFFSGLSEISSSAMPLKISCLLFASNMSTTSVPTVYSLTTVWTYPCRRNRGSHTRLPPL